MIKDIIDSFKENVSQKTSNPFLATILIVWTFKNWRLLYALLYFDKKTTLKARLTYIENYYSEENFFYLNLAESIGYAFLVLIGTYLLLGAARLIVDTYNKIFVPWISKWTDKNSIVSKDAYMALYSECEQLEKRLEEEREAKSKIKRELELAETKNFDLKNLNNDFTFQIENHKATENDLKNKLATYSDSVKREQEYIDKIEALGKVHRENSDLKSRLTKLLADNEKLSEFVNRQESELRNNDMPDANFELELINGFEKTGLGNSYVEIGEKILNSEPLLKSDKLVRDLVSKELIIFRKDYMRSVSAFYDFSDLGKKVYNHFLMKRISLDQ